MKKMGWEVALWIKITALFVVCFVSTAGPGLAQPPLVITYSSVWKPLSYGEREAVQGILPDLMKGIIQDRMGYPLKNYGLPWGRAQNAVKIGEVDAFVTTATPERLTFSQASKESVFTLSFNAFYLKDGPWAEPIRKDPGLWNMAHARYCDVLGNGWANRFYEVRNYDFFVVRTIENCIKLLASGRADIVVHERLTTNNAIVKNQLQDVIAVYPTAMEESPTFPLLLSHESPYGEDFLDHFDQVVSQMKADGSLKALTEVLMTKHLNTP